MNREIKFRAWDGEKMHENIVPWQWDFVISRRWHKCEKSTGDGILGSGGSTGEFLVPGIRYKNIMQYTGLKDKNGKEIYEGDIVSFAREHNYIVQFSDCAFYLYHAKLKEIDNTPLRWGLLSRASELNFTTEVIGNIYENPELLK